MRLSARLQAEREFVERSLGASVICDRCGCTLADYPSRCGADLCDPCPAFMTIEAAKQKFWKREAKA